jgi:hypothetical protein
MRKRAMMFREKIIVRNALISVKIHKSVVRLDSLVRPLVKVGLSGVLVQKLAATQT